MISEFYIFCPYDESIVNGLYALLNSTSFMTEGAQCVNNERSEEKL